MRENQDRFFIGEIGISKVNLAAVPAILDDCIEKKHFGYICVTNSRTAYLANRDTAYCSIQNSSLLTLPDGMPLVWIAKRLGLRDVDKVSGKDLMDALFALSVEKGYSHFFFGSSEETIRQIRLRLREKYPDISVPGAVSPPFQDIEDFDIDALARQINELRPTFFWCGLGAPKQEMLISRLQEKLESTFSVGVGLAFEYIGGTVRRAPSWMRKAGLEWFYRLAQQPKNIPRAFKPFLWVAINFMVSSPQKNEQ